MNTESEHLKFIKSIEKKAFKRGYNEAIKKILKAARGLDADTMATPSAFRGSEFPHSEGNPFKVGTDSAAVYEYIKENPGLRGAAIIKQSGIIGKTVRSALYRMKNSGQAMNDGGKWWIK